MTTGAAGDPPQVFIEEHIQSLKWSHDTSDESRLLIEGNLRGLIHPLRELVAKVRNEEREQVRAHLARVAIDAVNRWAASPARHTTPSNADAPAPESPTSPEGS